MALAALPPSSLARDLSWDESIVPALRKRLEGESHALSKRMSAASMTSSDGYAPEPPASTSTQVYRERTGTPTFQQSRPSAIPRPSLQQSRPGEPAPSVQSRSSRSGSFQRSRTLSQPFPFDNVNPQTPPLTYPDATSRSNSPMVTTPRSTRIPVSRNRAGSASSHKQPTLNGVRVDSRNGSYKPNGGYYQSPAELAPDLWPVSEAQPSSVNSRSTMETVHSQVSKLVNEPPPFPNQSVSSRGGYDTPRMSTDSEERPFEHWYRGDVSRNGGVGELRVGRRQEMLEIANYGHTLRQASSRTAIGAPRSRSSSRGRDGQDHLYHRPRAGSVGARESLYIDDEQARKEALVLDERPLTDLDSDGEPYYNEGDTSYFDDYYTERPDDRTVSPPLSLERSDTPSTLVDASKSASFKSRLPTPTPRQISNPPRTETPTQRRSPSTVPSTPKISAPSHTPTAQRSPANGSTNANKRRAKSPAATGSVNAKRVRKKSPGPSKAVKAEDKRGSVAHYPDPGNEDLANAIPSWTQPVPASGNWDDVVLPVVARKKGLEGHYEQADGSPKPKPRVNMIEPAPGTFGFDHTKRRQLNVDIRPEDIPMDEFGQRTDTIRVEFEEPPESGKRSLQPSPRPTPPRSPVRTDSPAPFSQYATAPPNPTPLPQIQITRPSTEGQGTEVDGPDEGAGGCCKCVIM